MILFILQSVQGSQLSITIMIFKLILVLAAACHCQEHEYSIKTQVHHQQPQRVYHQEHVPVATYQEPAPIHENQYQAPAIENHQQAVTHQSEQSGHQADHQYQFLPQQESLQQHVYEAPVQYEHQQGPNYHETQSLQRQHASVHQEPPVYYHTGQEASDQHIAPIQQSHHENNDHSSHGKPIDYYAHPKYTFEYKVEDPHTGDNKFQHEARDGDSVKGIYSLHEADGSIRTVEYSSDKHSGFNAIVKHSAPGHHVQIESHHHN